MSVYVNKTKPAEKAVQKPKTKQKKRKIIGGARDVR